jgi:predicted DNA-binding transcriptional regulator YafY
MFRRHAFYFVALCRLRGEFRTFRIDRTRKLEATTERFARRRGIQASDYFADSWQLYQGEAVNVVVRFRGASARVVLASHHHPKEVIENKGPDELIYRVKVNGTEEIQRWLLGFGGEVEVLEPAELRDQMLSVGQAIVGNHGDD